MLSKVDDTYVMLETFYIGSLLFAILNLSIMWYLDFGKYKYLLMSNEERKVFEQTPEYLEVMELDKNPKLINKDSTIGRNDYNYGGIG